jgi:putative ATPase
MGLFDDQERESLLAAAPLAARMRPRSIEEFAGQTHFLGEGKLLRRMLQADRLTSIVFYGPPGTGKTSLATLIAETTHRHFTALNATTSGVKELRGELQAAQHRLLRHDQRTILFIDELHRFSKSQQDVLLPDVESGAISLIGATTANPFFSLVAPLISRSQVFEFQPLSRDELLGLLRRALQDTSRGLGHLQVLVDSDALEFFAEMSDGDGRRALTGLEIAVLSVVDLERRVTLEIAQESIQRKAIRYDADGDDHYDAASAFIKSMRGTDPDAAVYWLARMLEAGEDPRFIARRIVIAAAEDVGNADPQALVVANAAAQAVELIGLPEGRIPLAQAAIYVACAPKSNAAYAAIDAALQDVRQQAVLPVPRHLRDRHYAGAERLGHGAGYQYPHDAPEGWLPQDYLGVDRSYYQPTNRGAEAGLAEQLAGLRDTSGKTPEQAADPTGIRQP